MNATEVIDALNEGKTLVDYKHGTKLWQLNDRVTIQSPSIFAETPKITSWAVSENDNAQMFDSRNRCLMIVRAKYFEVME
jgi:hypothetical protein